MVRFGVILERIVHTLSAFLTRAVGPDENVSLRARIEDTERESLSNEIQIQRGKKRKRANDMPAYVLVDNRQGPSRGTYIPVQDIIGQAPSTYLNKLEALLLDDKVGRVAICGMEGTGKTFLMKHLHNFALNWVHTRFDYVVWVTLSCQFSVKQVQDAVAAAVMCDICDSDDTFSAGQKLSKRLGSLGRFVLFLDAVPGPEFSLEEVGIPVAVEGSMCKVVLTTNAALDCRMLDCFGKVELGPLPEGEACQLFMHEAGIMDMRSASRIHEIASSLAKECCGVPKLIANVAKCMRGVDDIREWRNALFKTKNLEGWAKFQ